MTPSSFKGFGELHILKCSGISLCPRSTFKSRFKRRASSFYDCRYLLRPFYGTRGVPRDPWDRQRDLTESRPPTPSPFRKFPWGALYVTIVTTRDPLDTYPRSHCLLGSTYANSPRRQTYTYYFLEHIFTLFYQDT